MCFRGDELVHHVLVFGGDANYSFPAAPLLAVGIGGEAFHVAGFGNDDD